MEAIRVQQVIDKDGHVELSGLPFKRGESVEIIVLASLPPVEKRAMTVGDLLDSGLFGMWADRAEISDSAEYTRRLREEAQHRDWSDDDPH